jgi:hypothetical protein
MPCNSLKHVQCKEVSSYTEELQKENRKVSPPHLDKSRQHHHVIGMWTAQHCCENTMLCFLQNHHSGSQWSQMTAVPRHNHWWELLLYCERELVIAPKSNNMYKQGNRGHIAIWLVNRRAIWLVNRRAIWGHIAGQYGIFLIAMAIIRGSYTIQGKVVRWVRAAFSNDRRSSTVQASPAAPFFSLLFSPFSIFILDTWPPNLSHIMAFLLGQAIQGEYWFSPCGRANTATLKLNIPLYCPPCHTAYMAHSTL